MIAITSPGETSTAAGERYTATFSAQLPWRSVVTGLVAVLYAGVLLLGIVAVVSSPRLALTLRSEQRDGTRIAWLMPGGNLWVMGLRPGDHVLRLDGHAAAGMSGSWEGQRIVVRGPTGQFLTMNAQAISRTAVAWPLLVLSPWFFLLGILLHLRAKPRAVGRAAFALFSLAAFALALGPASDTTRFTVANVAERLAVPFFAASFVGFFLVFPSVMTRTRGAWLALYIPAFAAGSLSTYATFAPSLYEQVYAVWLALLALYLCLGVVVAIRSWIIATGQGMRDGLRIIALAALLSALPFVALNLGPTLLGLAPPLGPERAVLGIGFLPVGFTYAVLRYEVVAVHLLQRWLLHATIWMALIGVYAATMYLGCWLAQATVLDRRDVVLGAVLLASAVSLSFPLCYGWLRRHLDRSVFHDTYEYRVSLHEISQGLSLGTGLDTLGRSLPPALGRLMDLEFVTVLACDGPLLRSLGVTGIVPADLPSLVVAFLDDPQGQHGPRSLDTGTTMVYLVPLRAEGMVAGCLCLGPKRNGEPFSVEDATLLQTLSGHLAASIRNAQLREELRAQITVLDALNGQLQHAQEEERARLVAELHDEPLQTALHLQRRIASDGGGRTATEEHLLLSERIVNQLRALCMEVRPAALTELGLAAALEVLADDLEQHASLPITLETDATIEDLPLAPEAELVLYRAAQEALNNALKHAHASELRVALSCHDRCIVLAVLDDGIGFEVPASSRGLLANGHLGLAGLRRRVERAGGSMEVSSRAGCGTRVQIRLPIGGA